MFSSGNHKELRESLDTIGACVAIFEASPESQSYALVTANSLFEQLIKRSVSECIGAKIEELFDRYVVLPLKENLGKSSETQESIECEITIDSQGKSHWWRFIISPILSGKTRSSRIMVTCLEITDKKILERELTEASQRFEAVVESAYDGIIVVDDNQNIKLINSSAQEIFQIKDENLSGEPLTTLIPQRYRHSHITYVEGFRDSSIKARPMHSRAPVIGLRRDGSEFPIEVSIAKINVGRKVEMTAVMRDVSERARLVDELAKAATEDHLTGLPNRRTFERDFRREVLRFARFKAPLALVIIDIDDFRNVNTDYGHAGGDFVLKEIADLLKTNIRELDSIARWGGEEFTVLLPGTDSTGAATWSEHTRELIEKHQFSYNNQEIKVTTSFGVACSNTAEYDEDKLFSAADENLYKAKRAGKNKVVS